MSTPRYTDLELYRRLLAQAQPYWPHVAGVFALSLLSTPLALLTPLPLTIAVDSVIGSQPLPAFLDTLLPAWFPRSGTSLLVLAAVLTVAIGLLNQLHGLGNWLLPQYTGDKLVLGFRSQLFRHAQRLSLSYHDTRGPADSVYRIQYDAGSIGQIAVSGVIPFISAGLTLVGMVWVTAWLDWQLALVALAVAPVLYVLTYASSRRVRRRWSEVKELESSALSVVQEVLSAIRVVKAFGQEDREQERFVRHSHESLRRNIQIAFIEAGFDVLVGLTISVGMAVVLFIGVLHVNSGILTLGQLLLVMAYLLELYRPLATISKKVTDLQAALSSAERAFALLDESPDVPERPHARHVRRAPGAIAFRSVSFGYTPDSAVLRDISFDVPAGASVGIAGTTGAGKTTLINLLTRFYDPTAGQILLDGVDLRNYKLADLRNQFAIVLQEPVLLSTSIAENIAYARPGAAEDQIFQAAKAADAHGFIERLPDGYQTPVGERGMRLSGGERQRISLARAFLKDPALLILDEPTSSVDLTTEASIMEAMQRLMRGRTTFMIAHRLSTLQHCDVLLVIDSGRLGAMATDLTPAMKARLAGHDSGPTSGPLGVLVGGD